MINNLFNKKVLAVVSAVTLSVSSVALAFTTSGGYGLATDTPSASASASVEPSTEEKPTEEKPTVEKPTEEITTEAKPTPSANPSANPSEKPSDPVEVDTYQILGTLVGTWDLGSGAFMIQSKDDANVYTYTVPNVKAGSYEFQIVKNNSWDTKYSGAQGFINSDYPNLKCEVKEDCDVTVTLNLKDMTVKTSVDEEPAEQTDLSAATVKLAKAKTTYNGQVQAPVVTAVVLGTTELKAGVDYEVKAMNPKSANKYTVLVNGIGNYKGQACANYEITKKSIKSATATVGSKTYTGKKLTSSKYTLKIKLNGKVQTLKLNKDFTVKAVSRTAAGSSTVKFTGKGNFTSATTAKFVVKAKSIKSTKITVSSSKVYTGKAVKATVKVKDGSKTLKVNKDYKLTFKNNKKIGKATVTIKGKGNYSGSVNKTFKIVPGKASIKKAVNVKGNKVKVTIKGVKGATSYKVSYRVKGAKKWSTVTSKKTTVVLSKLKKNKTYQIKVAATAKSGKTTYTGAESSTKSVKVKK
ncbi:MAG: hypothetical protein K2M78_01215 [Lachnospiraceae bacterium]|nr:hypothetical protein [Lachnospiraceae bacterium]